MLLQRFFFLLLLYAPFTGWAQAPSCGFDPLFQLSLTEPERLRSVDNMEQEALRFFRKNQSPDAHTDELTVPVVVHIVHGSDPSVISDDRIEQAVAWLNDAFANDGFYDQGTGTDAGIRFCLARRDPDGQPTNGITRHVSPLADLVVETQDLDLKKLVQWDPKSYLNIWVVANICSNAQGCDLGAYAFSPAYHGLVQDGIVIEAAWVGDTEAYGSLLAHEAGHYLGLYHTFQGGCLNNDCLVNGDRICDTPPDQSSAPTPCGQPVNTCTTDFPDLPDMTSNFLDYGYLDCQHDFTPGQAARMQFFLTGKRKSLLDSKGCLPACPAPVAVDFAPADTLVHLGAALSFQATATNAAGLQWWVNGALVAQGATLNYVFSDEGSFTVQLVASPADTLLCEAQQAAHVVSVSCPVIASFTLSDTGPFPGEWVGVTNTGSGAVQFEWLLNGQSFAFADSFQLPAPGIYRLDLIARGAVCADTTTQYLSVIDTCQTENFTLKMTSSNSSWGAGPMAVLANGQWVMAYGNTYAGLTCFDATGNKLWEKQPSPGGAITALCPSPTGGFFVAKRDDLSQPAVCWVMRLDEQGEVVWSRTFPINALVSLPERVRSMEAFPDGSVAICGTARNNGVGNLGAFVAKLDPDGNLLWSHLYREMLASAEDLEILPDNSLMVTGAQRNGFINGLVMLLDADGLLQWHKTLKNQTQNACVFSKIIRQNDGSFLLVGRSGNFYNLDDADNYFGKGIVIKIQKSGQIEWRREFTASGTPYPGLAFPMAAPATNRNGALVLSSLYFIDTNTRGFAVLKIAEDGSVPWTRLFNNGQNLEPGGLTLVNQGGYLISANAYSGFPGDGHVQIMKIDEAGNSGACDKEPFPYTEAELLLTIDTPALSRLDGNLFSPAQASSSTVVSSFSREVLCAFTCDTLVVTPELCFNNLDDDGDGLFDCLDPDCDCPVDPCQTGRNQKWYFGYGNGLDFSTEPPTVLDEGEAGRLQSGVWFDILNRPILYTASGRLNDRFHQEVANSSGKPGDYNLFVGHPANPAEGYLFAKTGTQLSCHTIDWQAGALTTSETLCFDCYTSNIAAVRCGPKIWIIDYRDDAKQLVAYPVDNNGVGGMPVTTEVQQGKGLFLWLKTSPNGRLLAVANDEKQHIEIHRFNPADGTFDPQFFTIPYPSNSRAQGLEFSPNSRFLYASFLENWQPNVGFTVWQYDLLSDEGPAERIVKQDFPGNEIYFGGMQLAPNGTILISPRPSVGIGFPPDFLPDKLSLISRPNDPGQACAPQLQVISMPNTINSFLANVITTDFATPYLAFKRSAPDTVCRAGVWTAFPLHSGLGCPDSLTLTLEGLGGEYFFHLDTAFVRFDGPAGNGRLIAGAWSACGSAFDTLSVTLLDYQAPVLDLGPDRIICENGAVPLVATPGFAEYQWQNGFSEPELTTLFPGLYWVEVRDWCGDLQRDSLWVSIDEETRLDLGPDIEQCPGLPLSFSRPDAFAQWVWTPDEALNCDTCSTVALTPVATGAWQVVGQTAAGCLSVDTLYVTVTDTVNRFVDTLICPGQAVRLGDQLFLTDTTAQVRIQAQGPGCDTVVYLTLSTFPELNLSLPGDTSLRIGASVALEAGISGPAGLQYAWSPPDGLSCTDCLVPVAMPLQTTVYTLEVLDDNLCRYTDSVRVEVTDTCRLIIPNAFTPNGDQTNDRFYPITDPCIARVLLWAIYNRWGEKVFEQKDFEPNQPSLGWDGSGSPSDTYIYQAQFEYFDGRVEVRSGEVVLLR